MMGTLLICISKMATPRRLQFSYDLYRRGYFFINVWRKNIFDIYVTEYGTALTTILPILFLYLNTVIVTAETFEP
jgi:hypothetical protein